MKDKDESLDKETVLLTLDQLSQTVEVMEHVIDKLRRYLNKSSTKIEHRHIPSSEQKEEDVLTDLTEKSLIH